MTHTSLLDSDLKRCVSSDASSASMSIVHLKEAYTGL